MSWILRCVRSSGLPGLSVGVRVELHQILQKGCPRSVCVVAANCEAIPSPCRLVNKEMRNIASHDCSRVVCVPPRKILGQGRSWSSNPAHRYYMPLPPRVRLALEVWSESH